MENEKTVTLPRPVRRKLWLILLLPGIFFGGMVVGSALTVAVAVRRIRDVTGNPEKTAGRIIARMDRYLDLTNEQEAEVKTIVRNTLDDLLAQRAAVRRQTLLRLAAARREMDAVLTPEQQQKLDDRFGRLRKLWGVAPEGNGP
ncbi:MAG: hypothetical protein WC789_10985 [Lentisphaeria bacterium]|jgi:Spy/CpxP family protein refolding chaperone